MKVYELFYLFYLASGLTFYQVCRLSGSWLPAAAKISCRRCGGPWVLPRFRVTGPTQFRCFPVLWQGSAAHGSEVNTHWPRSYMAAGAGLWSLYFTWHPDLWMIVMDD